MPSSIKANPLAIVNNNKIVTMKMMRIIACLILFVFTALNIATLTESHRSMYSINCYSYNIIQIFNDREN